MNHGNMFIRFGEPISLKQCWDNFKRQISSDDFIASFKDKNNQHDMVNRLAYEVSGHMPKCLDIETKINLSYIFEFFR